MFLESVVKQFPVQTETYGKLRTETTQVLEGQASSEPETRDHISEHFQNTDYRKVDYRKVLQKSIHEGEELSPCPPPTTIQ